MQIELKKIKVVDKQLRLKWVRPEYSESPSKPTLVFLHDAIGGIEQWRGYPEEIVSLTGCPALIYERLGSGESDPLPQKRTPQYLEQEALETLPEVLRLCGIQDILLIGHSDGASITLIFGGNCPPEINLRGIISESAHVFVEEITLEGIRQMIDFASRSDFKKKLSKFHHEKTEDLFAAWTETWLAENYRNWNIEKHLSSISCPSLIIQGEEDEYGTLAQVSAITTQVKGPAQTLIIPDCAHFPHYQAKEKVTEAMKKFILQNC